MTCARLRALGAVCALLTVALNARALEPGRMAPAFDLPRLAAAAIEAGANPAADRVMLEAYRGQVVYLDFWSSWCAPCRRILPGLERLRADWADEPVAVIGLNLDNDRRDALRVLEQTPVRYPVALDVGGATARRYGVEVLPAAVVIDAAGRVVRVLRGSQAEDAELAAAAIAEALAAAEPDASKRN